MGNISSYCFLVHQVVIKYLRTVVDYTMGVRYDTSILFTFIALVLTVVGVEIWRHLKDWRTYISF